VLLDGCDSMQDLQLQINKLNSAGLDGILTALDTSATNLLSVNLLSNAQFPSAVGYAHYSSLTNKHVSVFLDFPTAFKPIIEFQSMALIQEGCLPTNNAVDPNETVTVNFTFRNIGQRNTTNLVVTLLSTNGITAPPTSQSYGVVIAGGAPATQPFTFSATGACGGTVTARLQLQDGLSNLGTVSVPMTLGLVTVALAEDFDAVTAPALPSDWTTSAVNGQQPWETTTVLIDSAPNAAVSGDPASIGVNELVSPAVVLPSTPTQLTFRNRYDLEPATAAGIANDGGVLEIKIGTNAFTDILAAGGTFLSGGYNRTITNIWGNPLAGRQSWSGDSGGFITTSVNLPAAALGQTVQLKWRCGTDNGNDVSSLDGWRIDAVRIISPACCTGGP
jgi:hypothetical protein